VNIYRAHISCFYGSNLGKACQIPLADHDHRLQVEKTQRNVKMAWYGRAANTHACLLYQQNWTDCWQLKDSWQLTLSLPCIGSCTSRQR